MSIGAVAAIATVGPVVFSATAHAADANSKVWVCKYVRTPGGDEVLKDGKNPIFVNGHSVDKDKDGQIYVGDQFADAQERSVVVQIEGRRPGSRHLLPDTSARHADDSDDSTGPTTPGTTAPVTGGEGSGVPAGLLGGGVLLVGSGLLAAEAARRRRAASRP